LASSSAGQAAARAGAHYAPGAERQSKVYPARLTTRHFVHCPDMTHFVPPRSPVLISELERGLSPAHAQHEHNTGPAAASQTLATEAVAELAAVYLYSLPRPTTARRGAHFRPRRRAPGHPCSRGKHHIRPQPLEERQIKASAGTVTTPHRQSTSSSRSTAPRRIYATTLNGATAGEPSTTCQNQASSTTRRQRRPCDSRRPRGPRTRARGYQPRRNKCRPFSAYYAPGMVAYFFGSVKWKCVAAQRLQCKCVGKCALVERNACKC